MRLFYLTTEFLWPPLHGGRVRSLGQLRLLLRQPELTVLRMFSLTEVPVSQADLAALRDGLGHPTPLQVVPPVFHPIHLRKHTAKLIEVGLRRLLWGTPYLFAKWQSAAVAQALSVELLSDKWDVVYVDHIGMGVYLPLVRRLCPQARVVIETHNVESEFFAQFAAQKPQPLRLVAEREADAAAVYEAKTLCAADAAVAISDRDARELRALAFRTLGRAILPLVVPQVVEPAPVPLPKDPAPRVVYVGNLTWHPNVAGLDWLCQNVWPLVRAALPNATLTIAGSGLSPKADGTLAVPTLWQGPGIDVVGFVPSLAAFVEGSPVLAAPVFGGSGVRIKLLDSLRLGIPTVTTSDGASGLPLADGQQVRICDRAQDFADALVMLCRDGALREKLRTLGLDFIRQHHSAKQAQTAMRMAIGLPTLAN